MKIDRIYTKSISRFARNTKDCLNTVRLLKELGISIFFEKENIDTAKTTDEFMITIMGSLAQEESTSISQNLRWSVRKRMESGTYVTPSIPYGYIRKNGNLVIDPPKAKVVKMIFGWYLSGMGVYNIIRELERLKIPPISGGKHWHIFPIQYILTNERYVGNMLLQKSYASDTLPIKRIINKGEKECFLVTESHEPIISIEEFNKVQQLFKENESIYYKRKGEKTVFTSIIKCRECGASYKQKKNRGKYYWVCRNHDMKAEYCSSQEIPDECLKQAFIKMCNKLTLHYREILLPLQRSLQELNSRRFCGNAKILDIHKGMADFKEQRHVIARLRKRGFLDEQKYNEKLAEIDSKLAKYEHELSKLSKADIEDATLEQLDTLIDCIESRNTILTEFDEKLFSTIVEKVVVTDGTLEFSLISGLKFCENI